MSTLATLLGPFNHVMFTTGSDHVSVSELLGFITGAVGVYLIVKQRMSNFPVNLANNVFFLLLFIQARLWADGGLQIVYFILGIQGWYAWLTWGPNRTELHVSRATSRLLAIASMSAIVITVVLWPLLRQANDIAPFLDALTTGLSLGAQLLLNLKRVQNWWYWIVADIIYVPLYFYKNLYLTAIVYVLFLGLSIAGLRSWRAEVAADEAATDEAGSTTSGSELRTAMDRPDLATR